MKSLAAIVLVLALSCSANSTNQDVRNSVTPTQVAKKKAAANVDGGSTTGSGQAGFGNNTAQSTVVKRDAGLVDAGPAPDKTDCGSVEVVPMVKMTVTPGNLLIVFDESGSMNEDWGQPGVSKWQAANQAMSQALTPLQSQIAEGGAIFFPNPGDCDVAAIDSGSQINFIPGPQFITAWNTYTSAHGPNGKTPTGTAMQLADTALTNAASILKSTTAVVLITDGDPNCNTDDNQVKQVVASWFAKGIKTHVLGLPGSGGSATDRLTAIAVAGGTNTFITPSDPMALQTELAKIVSSSVTTNFDSCAIPLPMAPANPDDVHLVVTQQGVKQDVARDLGSGGGWTLNAQLTEIALQGLFCDLAKKGEYEKISVAFGCVELPPLPPPKPVS